MSNKKILVLFFHPRFEDSKANKGLLKAIDGMSNVTIRDMYEQYPDFNIAIKLEQQLLLEHDIIVWQYPFFWYNCPPLMKQWIDLVLELGWAYGRDGDKLEGKYLFNVITSGGSFEVYQKTGRNRFTYREFLNSFEQTAYLCHMDYLPPFIIPAAGRLTEEQLEEYGDNYRNLLITIQQPDFDFAQLENITYFNNFKLLLCNKNKF
ncbi:MAG: NAD(P)H oxidoreductase [Saprospiraceae bacterium]|nr:NAD(P)H oxidoreductase [Saprospiraceae bacterium]